MKGYRTLIFALLLAVFGALQIGLPTVREFVEPSLYGWVTLVVAVIVAALRVATTTPWLESGE